MPHSLVSLWLAQLMSRPFRLLMGTCNLPFPGLHYNHSYLVMESREYQDPQYIRPPVQLVKLRNADWATQEWRGDWGPRLVFPHANGQ